MSLAPAKAKDQATYIAVITSWAAQPPVSRGRTLRNTPFRATARVVLRPPPGLGASTLLLLPPFPSAPTPSPCPSALVSGPTQAVWGGGEGR